MRDKDLYAQILDVQKPWFLRDDELRSKEREVYVFVGQEEYTPHTYPKCGAHSPWYYSRKRRWRHLDTCQFKTIVVADIPRVQCPELGIITADVPWAEAGSGFTALFEALVID